MQANELLSVTPAELIQAILARRQSVASHLPDDLERRQEENNRAYALTKEAKAHLDALIEQGETTKEAQESLQKARDTYEEHEQFRRRSSSRLQTIKTTSTTAKKLSNFGALLPRESGGISWKTPNASPQAANPVLPEPNSKRKEGANREQKIIALC